jgi:hypothetical protein
MNFVRKVKLYPVTSSLIFFNLSTYYYRQVYGLKKSEKKLKLEKWESYLRRDEIPQYEDLIKNFTQYNCSLDTNSLALNITALLFIGRNLEILYGSRLLLVIEASNYLLHLFSFYFSKINQFNYLFVTKKTEDYSMAFTLALMSHSIPINLPLFLKIGVFLFTLRLMFSSSVDTYLFSSIISSFLITYFVRKRYRVI